MSGPAAAASALADLLGPSGWLTQDVEARATDWLGRVSHRPLGVALPRSADEVAATLRVARAHRVPVTPQGGNTSLCAGAVPGAPGAVVLSLERMDRILDVDAAAMTATVEAGVVLGALHARLEGTGLHFPLHLGAEGSARIGGLVATNAGGSHAARHGMMADRVLGLEVALADGALWDGLRGLVKDNAGYALRRLFCGSEGTLGVVTRAVLRLAPEPRRRATALLAVDGLDAATALGRRLQGELGELVDALEFLTDVGLGWALEHVEGLAWPLDGRDGAWVLVELASTSAAVPLDELLETALGEAMEAGLVTDGAIAASGAQRAAFWRVREELPEGQRREGAQLKHDVSVPVGAVARFVHEASAALDALLPGIRVNAFGHLGDGNVHFNVSPPVGEEGFGDRARELSMTAYRIASGLGGSIAAEHGLGRTKVDVADALRDPVERALMRDLKRALDPDGVLNPGAVTGARTRPAPGA